MATKKAMSEQDEETAEQRPYTNEASIRLVNFLYDADEDHMPGLTWIKSTREAFMISIQITREAALLPRLDKKGNKMPLTRVWRNSYFMLKRSIDMKAFKFGIGLAHGQTEEEAEQAAEESDF